MEYILNVTKPGKVDVDNRNTAPMPEARCAAFRPDIPPPTIVTLAGRHQGLRKGEYLFPHF